MACSSSSSPPPPSCPVPDRVIYIIRHGESMANIASFEDPSLIDAALSPEGHSQAASLRDELRAKEIEVDLVVVSPLRRALQTASIVFHGSSVPFRVCHHHSEILSDWGNVGRRRHILAEEHPHIDFSSVPNHDWWLHGQAYPNSSASNQAPYEPHGHAQERIHRFLAWLHRQPEKRIAIVGHSHFFFRMYNGTACMSGKRQGSWMRNCEMRQFDLYAHPYIRKNLKHLKHSEKGIIEEEEEEQELEAIE